MTLYVNNFFSRILFGVEIYIFYRLRKSIEMQKLQAKEKEIVISSWPICVLIVYVSETVFSPHICLSWQIE